ncbi:MAG: hypothetical protein ABI647_09300 [Gemmatimonadota bacterium]
MVTSGQPTPAHLEALKQAGVEIILDIRDPMEPRPFDEAALVRSLGMEYINVPVSSATLSDETMDRVLEVVRANQHRRMLFHCASANRVGGALIPHFILDRGMSEDDAVQAAMRIGLRAAELMEWGVDYAKSHGK